MAILGRILTTLLGFLAAGITYRWGKRMARHKKIVVTVKLPETELITPLKLAEAVANAIFPVAPSDLKGVKCIVGKELDFKRGIGHWVLEWLPAPIALDEKREFDTRFTYRLSPDEWSSLEDVLPQLPTLQYPVSEQTRTAFRKALWLLPGWKNFSPRFLEEIDLEGMKLSREECIKEHLIALGRAVKEGRIGCCDAQHIPMSEIGLGALIPRNHARAYLQSIGLPVSDVDIESATSVSPMEMANEVDWKKSKYVSGKLRALCQASERWRDMPFAETTTKEQYSLFHNRQVVPMLKRPAFKARQELERRAAEYIRPLYARRRTFKGHELEDEYLNIRSPELTALLLASRLWEGWEKKGNKPRPTKSDIAAAIRQALPSWLQVTESFMADGPKILQLEAADTGREMQFKNANRLNSAKYSGRR